METGVTDQAALFATLSRIYYQVVPEQYKTYCALTAAISRRTLGSFGIDASLLACQVWCATPSNNFVVGFSGNSSAVRWPGHAICATDDWFIDAAMHHFKRDFGLNVPDVAVGRRFKLPSQSISRIDLSPTDRLWWSHAPPGVDPTVPSEPDHLIEEFSGALTARLKAVA